MDKQTDKSKRMWLRIQIGGWKHYFKRTPDFGGTWAKREKLAEETGKLDYGCRFENGVCKKYREHQFGGDTAIMCCCSGCAGHFGYIDNLPKRAVRSVLQLFDTELGFWRKGIGCTLPRKWRSRVCLRYMCVEWELKKTYATAQEKLIQIGVLESNIHG